ncbi:MULTISPECIES: putative peptidoglycan glycosyltransferase FtsW [Paracoccus]|uniref:Probable peptidoglycan glycosyltransferase FtsW n=1 Tax=Paracoccus litorisediminis TaxID=2006130 RepID=A0A844HIA0_9RHOB|nr:MULTISPECIES: putative peptidoglycan glycosyltransferase FtsW [Paracoccus]MBD9525505.1 cell division protein FtsW [Paracoccus sp. PAR01]MTH57955.1 cell division protein FtsW [Paracoccus litorisediminis]
MTEMVFGTTPVRAGDPILPRWWRTVDRWSLACVLGLFAMGLLLGLAASVPLAEKNNLPQFYYVTRQAIFGSMAIGAMLVVSMFSPRFVRRIGVFGFAIAIVAIVLLPFIGTDFGKGAVRWLRLPGGMSVQPSEFLKPCFIAICAWFMAASQEVGGPPGKIYSFGIAATVVLLLAMQPDFGQASLVLFSWCVMYFIAGAPIALVIGVIGLAMIGGVFSYGASEHFARRIDGFLAAEVDPRTQIGYATNAIQEGGFFGVGVGEGSVKWSLPDAHTDFIIAVAAEEYGLIMVLAIIVLYMTVVVRSLLRLRHERDPFARIAGTGLACAFGVQALINMGVAVRLLPAKGMTLPFVSYGGSSVIASGIAVGMLLALTRSRPQGRIADVLGRGRR